MGEKWNTLIIRVSNNDYYRKKDRGQFETYGDLSEYHPIHVDTLNMGLNGNQKIHPLRKIIKVLKQNGGFEYYSVPVYVVGHNHSRKLAPEQVAEPILNLATLNNQLAVIETQKQPILKLTVLKPIASKSTPIVKLPVPLNLLPYIANVSSDGVVFFNIPEGYTNDLFLQAVQAVYGLNKELALKPMIYYERPKLLVLQLKQQLLAVLLSLKLYLEQRLKITLSSLTQRLQTALELDIKHTTNGLTKTIIAPYENVDKPDLVTEVFAYPYREVNVYNIHPEAYLKVLEYLNNNFNKIKTNNKQEKKIHFEYFWV